MYCGQYGVQTDDNGLIYMRARYYATEIQRFLSLDPVLGSVSDSQSLNRYAFCVNDPINRIDPLGADSYIIYDSNAVKGIGDIANKYKKQLECTYPDTNIYLKPVSSSGEFVDTWNSMTGSIDTVIIYMHGEGSTLKGKAMKVGNDWLKLTDEDNAFSDLEVKNINNLVMFSCYAGVLDECGNDLVDVFFTKGSKNIVAAKDKIVAQENSIYTGYYGLFGAPNYNLYRHDGITKELKSKYFGKNSLTKFMDGVNNAGK